MPSNVSLTAGGAAKITVATSAGVAPSPKNTTIGTRYTNAGIVCIMSSVGLAPASTARDLAASIPIGTPITSETTVEARTSAKESIVASQSPRLTISGKQNAEKTATGEPKKRTAIIPNTNTNAKIAASLNGATPPKTCSSTGVTAFPQSGKLMSSKEPSTAPPIENVVARLK